jgi:hypothetical protein
MVELMMEEQIEWVELVRSFALRCSSQQQRKAGEERTILMPVEVV